MNGGRIGTLLVAAATMLAGCGGGHTGDGTTALELVPPSRLAAVSADVERQLYAASGLDAALGGAAASAASVEETAAWIASVITTIKASPIAGSRRAVSASPDLSAGLFGGMLVTGLVGETAVNRTNDGVEQSVSQDGFTIEASVNVAATSTDLTYTDSQGVTTTLKTSTNVLPCPDADGAFVIEASIDTTSSVDGGRVGKRAHLEVRIVGIVGDDAQVLETNTEVRGEVADAGPSGTKYADVSIAYPANAPSEVVVNGYGGDAVELAKSASSLAASVGAAVGAQLQNAAQKAWESGRCVKLVPSVSAGPHGLSPNTKVVITAAPRSVVDGTPAGGSVIATLAAGGAAVDPGGKVKADATFAYTAPSTRDQTGTVKLEARSRRGIGKATIDFDTKAGAYQAEGGGDGGVTTGTISDLSAPFTLSSEYSGGSGTYSFSGGMSGTLTFEGTGGDTTQTGDGTYDIVANDDGTLTLTLDSSWCITLTGACAPTTEVIVLTPVE